MSRGPVSVLDTRREEEVGGGGGGGDKGRTREDNGAQKRRRRRKKKGKVGWIERKSAPEVKRDNRGEMVRRHDREAVTPGRGRDEDWRARRTYLGDIWPNITEEGKDLQTRAGGRRRRRRGREKFYSSDGRCVLEGWGDTGGYIICSTLYRGYGLSLYLLFILFAILYPNVYLFVYHAIKAPLPWFRRIQALFATRSPRKKTLARV